MEPLQCQKEAEALLEKIQEADAILVGAASGMSSAAGYDHYYRRSEEFVQWCGKFEQCYGYHCSFDGFYHRYPSTTKRWAYMATMIQCILHEPTGQPYLDIQKLLEGKTFHILTTNQDTQFAHIFPESKISAIQGDWRYLQCSRPCHDAIYDAVLTSKRVFDNIDDNLDVAQEFIPKCPKCGADLEPWVRSYTFLEGEKYEDEYRKVQAFLGDHWDEKLLLLELGVGRMTPMFIQQPFWNLTAKMPQAFYMTINPKDAILPQELRHKGMALHSDIAQVFADACTLLEQQ